MRYWKGLAFAFVGFLAAQGARAQNTIGVTTLAAMEGTYGLEVFCDADSGTNNVSVETTHPNAETHYKASFLLRPGELQLPNTVAIRMAQIITPGGQSIIIMLKKNSSGNWAVLAKLDDDRAGGYIPLNNQNLVNAGAEQTAKLVTIEYQVDSSNGASDGYLKLTRCNTDGITNCSTRSDLLVDNETLTVDSMKIGILLGTGAGCSGDGAYDFDGFASYR